MGIGSKTLPLVAERRRSKPISLPVFVGVLRTVDLIAIVIPSLIIYEIHLGETGYILESNYIAVILLVVLVSSILFQWLGIYSSESIFEKKFVLGRLCIAWLATFACLLAFAFALKITSSYSRVWSVSWFLTSGSLLILIRLLFLHWIQALARQGRFAKRTIIWGMTEQGQKLAQYLLNRRDTSTDVIGFIDDRQAGERVPEKTCDRKLLGDTSHLIRLIREGQVDQVLVALPWNAEHRLHNVMRELVVTPVTVRLAPDLIGLDLSDRPLARVAGLPMMGVFDRPISDWSYVSKWIEDRLIASLALAFLAPLLLLISVAIKMTSKGPVIFKQKRYGFNYHLIEVYKFRTMYVDVSNQDGSRQATRDDPRVTPIGRFLRMTSLDELPQLFNVLRGDMSIVGPRPHPIGLTAAGRQFEEIVDLYAARHRVKPGITGLAQVRGWRGETETVEKIQRRVECDLHYIDNWSIWLDLQIILKTFVVIFRNENAY